MKKLTFTLCSLALATASAASSASDTYILNGNIYTKQNSWIVEAGVAGSSDLVKDQKDNVGPLLNVGYQGEDFNVAVSGINYRFLGNDSDRVNMSAYLSSSGLAFDKDSSDYLKGMSKRKMSVDLGLNADFKTAQGTLSTYFQHDVSGAYKGYNASIRYFHPMSLGTMDFVPFTGLSYLNEDYVDYYFGVKKKEATAKRKAYKGSGDFSYHVGYKLILPLSEQWELTQTTSFQRLGKKIADSPIVDDANQWMLGATVAYHF
ncbi:outer membrane protein OmpV [Vibrio sinaloensis]|uniref:outer membrane protein OmpV n=1 Tax=Photobacterium sp. (strain ATCC 43367) TaxID=379097 RepID=UPI00204DB7CF|nr:MipA/OmpV family protein [Vibrio sinaloensis]UPQ89123.1 MipA/OmpV family protein [Vibrio sinaloensis]